jgi:hypothetical protein
LQASDSRPSPNAAPYGIAGQVADQHWLISRTPNGFNLVNRNSGKCLVVQTRDDDARAFQYDYPPGFADQFWTQAL